MKNNVISKIDKDHLRIIRGNVSRFLKKCGRKYDKKGLLLDIAPQDHEGAIPYFKKMTIQTLDINKKSGATFIADICKKNNKIISSNVYNLVVCTEVLEHTLEPFAAVEEIYRILKKGGMLLLSVPFNFRIHGPLPDCWRFTEHGLISLLKKFEIIEIDGIETRNRWLMPVCYTVIARKNK
ncbi:MAG TPA: methyltransferase domain-containing protein [Candidatus Kapabacteria bacterium]|nr:methyltransferase domain-containing protein [Candidatus Kapabacteria bacterium]